MGSFNTRITTDEYAMADTMVIDEGGIDLLLDGDQVIAASFEGLDHFQIMRHIVPEDLLKPKDMTQVKFEELLVQIKAESEGATKEEREKGIDMLQRTIVGSLITLALLKEAAK